MTQIQGSCIITSVFKQGQALFFNNWTVLNKLMTRNKGLFTGVNITLISLLCFFSPDIVWAEQQVAENPYRHLDWISPAEVAALPASERPQHSGICEGLYVVPQLGDGLIKDAEIKASADHFDTLPDGTNVLRGNVEVKQGPRELYSDEVRLNRETRATSLQGNVVIRQPGMLILGDSAEINLNEKAVDVKNTEYVIHEIHVHGTAARIYNPEEKVLVLDRSTYTTCEPNDKAWAIAAKEIKLNQESGWGSVTGATLEIGGVPVIYLPWWTFPIDDRRQSGFLFPYVGSGDSGLDLSLPYYVNIAPNMDATLTPRYLANRGEMLETEFRYLTPHTEGQVGLGYLANDKIYQDSRSLVNWQHKGLYGDWTNSVDYTRVGDSDHFLDLDTTLDATSNTHLAQRADFNRYGENWNFKLMVQQFQTIDDIIADEDLPYRMLPQIQANSRYPVANTPLSTGVETEYTYFDHPEDLISQPTSANRVKLNPYLQLNLRNSWGFLIPRLSYNLRYYSLNQTGLDDDEKNLEIPVTSIDSGLFLDRQLEFSGKGYVQTLEPRLFYLYVPMQEQNDLPIFDTAKTSFGFEQLFRANRFTGNDRIGDANQLSLGLTTRLIDSDGGQELFNVSLGQILYFRDREVQLNESDPIETTTLSPFVARVNWLINSVWSWRSETQWDSQENNLDSIITGFDYRDEQRNVVNLTYNYYDNGAVTADPASEEIKQTDVSFAWSLNPRWSIVGRWGFDLNQSRSFDNIVGVEYESCCWRIRLVNRRFLKESNDEETLVEPSQTIMLNFELKGLGGFGGSVDSALDESIPGYRQREELRPPPFGY